MWLRHFASRKGTRRYKTFKIRYESFSLLDTVELCKAHHEEIHTLYMATIQIHIMNNKLKPLWAWSWKQAEALMTDLRLLCDKWLQQVTPGAKTFKLLR